MIGDTETTNISIENTFALSFVSNKSLTIALAATIPTQPPIAWKSLNTIKLFTEPEKAQPTEAKKKRQSPAYKGGFLPKRSSNGPYNNCPAEIPIKKLERDNVTSEIVLCKSFAIAGNAGRYISIDKWSNCCKQSHNQYDFETLICGIIRHIVLLNRQNGK
jgi:hypothetical protein